MADLPGWFYYKIISITGQSGAGTDYQIKLEIGDSAGGDFHLEGNCTNFPQDVRITDDDGTTLLDYWVEDITADPIIVYVEVKDDLGSNRDIRVYYGKSGETTASNGANTFIFFDDFSGDLSKWTIEQAYATIESGRLKLTHSGNNNPIIRSDNTYGPLDIALEFDMQHVVEGGYQADIYGGLTDVSTWGWGGGDWVLPYRSVGTYANYYINTVLNGSSTQTYSSVPKTSVKSLHTVELYSGHARHLYNGTNLHDDITNIPNSAMHIKLGHRHESGTNHPSYYDDVRIRKYNSPEPAFSSAGGEQSVSVGWSDKIIGVSSPSKVNGIAATDISKILGVA